MLPTIPGLDVVEADRRRGPDGTGALLVDVREKSEFDELRAEDVLLLPLSTLPGRLGELPPDRELLFICRSGARSGQVTAHLRAQGREDVWNVTGGMIAWERAGLPVRTGPPDPGEGGVPA